MQKCDPEELTSENVKMAEVHSYLKSLINGKRKRTAGQPARLYVKEDADPQFYTADIYGLRSTI